MGDIRMRVEAVGWHYQEVDGHDPERILAAFESAILDPRPSFILATTTKGAGVNWMENFDSEGDYYKFHSGALASDLYADAVDQLVSLFQGVEYSPGIPLDPQRNEFDAHHPRPRPASMLTLWEQALPRIMEEHHDIVILDGDLSYDTGTHLARKQFPDRYIQSGIAEQDMVSMAGTLALSGFTPIVHSFSTFLTMRAAEQIFNNATEYSRVLYFGFLAGLVPSAPGFSHQAVSDVGLMSSVPRMHVVEPACAGELDAAMAWALEQDQPVYFRMGNTSPIEQTPTIAGPGDLVSRRLGSGIAVVSSGPLLTEQALLAAEQISQQTGQQVAVYTMPWITSPLSQQAIKELQGFDTVFVLENHNPARAKHLHLTEGAPLGVQASVHRVGLEGIPQNGQPDEVLAHHGLDMGSLVGTFQLS
jgi:transketolase